MSRASFARPAGSSPTRAHRSAPASTPPSTPPSSPSAPESAEAAVTLARVLMGVAPADLPAVVGSAVRETTPEVQAALLEALLTGAPQRPESLGGVLPARLGAAHRRPGFLRAVLAARPSVADLRRLEAHQQDDRVAALALEILPPDDPGLPLVLFEAWARHGDCAASRTALVDRPALQAVWPTWLLAFAEEDTTLAHARAATELLHLRGTWAGDVAETFFLTRLQAAITAQRALTAPEVCWLDRWLEAGPPALAVRALLADLTPGANGLVGESHAVLTRLQSWLFEPAQLAAMAARARTDEDRFGFLWALRPRLLAEPALLADLLALLPTALHRGWVDGNGEEHPLTEALGVGIRSVPAEIWARGFAAFAEVHGAWDASGTMNLRASDLLAVWLASQRPHWPAGLPAAVLATFLASREPALREWAVVHGTPMLGATAASPAPGAAATAAPGTAGTVEARTPGAAGTRGR